MATLDATLAGEDSNSYCTVAYADAYAENQSWAADWDALTDDEKAVALIGATQWLETLSWAGTRCEDTQRLAWPRSDASCDGITAACTAIPRRIQDAEVELAWQFHQNPTAINGGGGAAAGTYVKRQKLGSLEVEYDQYTGTSVTGCDNCNDPAVITAFPWIKGVIGACWFSGLSGGVGLMLRVRS